MPGLLLRRRRGPHAGAGEDGFTLIEAMVVFAYIAILVVIAIPSMNQARGKAQDRAAQVDVRNGYTTAKFHYLEAQLYTADAPTLTALEPSIDFATAAAPVDPGLVYVHVEPMPHAVFISAKSNSGKCWYVRQVPALGTVDYASNRACGAATAQAYRATW